VTFSSYPSSVCQIRPDQPIVNSSKMKNNFFGQESSVLERIFHRYSICLMSILVFGHRPQGGRSPLISSHMDIHASICMYVHTYVCTYICPYRAQNRPIHAIQNIGARGSGGPGKTKSCALKGAKLCAPEGPWKVVYGCVPVTPREM
jgi:hypothetical protein